MSTKLRIVSDEQREVKEQSKQASLFEQNDAIIRAHARVVRFSWYEVGLAGKAINDGDLWKGQSPEGGEVYHSFEDYVNRTLQQGRSTIYRKMQLVEELGAINAEELKLIPECNAMWLLKLKKRLGESKWCKPKLIEYAQTMSEDEFEACANAALPGAAKEEESESIKIPKSQAKRWAKVKRVLAWKLEQPELVDDDRGAIEALGEEFMQQLVEVGAKQSNEAAFDARKKGKK
jgi:hypothetical protein